MTSQVQKHKYGKLFEVLDIDADGYIDEADMEAHNERLYRLHDIDAGNIARERIQRNNAELWTAALAYADKDADGRVSRDDWLAGSVLDGFAREVAVRVGLAFFHAVDIDHDGRVTEDEWLHAARAVGVSDRETHRNFEAFDTDRDGLINEREFADAAERFFLSRNPTVTGILFGRI